MEANKNWNFAVVGCDSHNIPKYLGFTETREEADALQKNMETVGWRRVTVFDAALEQVAALQKEVAQKDKTIAHMEDLLKRQQGLGYGRG